MLSLNPLLIDPAVRAALEEDLGRAGDITTQATIPAGMHASAVLSGDELAGMIGKIYATPPEVIAKVREAILDS